MQSFSSLEKLASCILVIGNLDGFHKGHQKIISLAKKQSLDEKIPLCVLSFYPHPKDFFKKKNFFYLSYKKDLKNSLEDFGVDHFFRLVFDLNFSLKSARQFIMDLKYFLNPKMIFCGSDFSFGKDQTGKPSLFHSYGIQTQVISDVTDNEEKISSSYLRNLIFDSKFNLFLKLSGKAFYRKFTYLSKDKNFVYLRNSLNFHSVKKTFLCHHLETKSDLVIYKMDDKAHHFKMKLEDFNQLKLKEFKLFFVKSL